MDKDTIINSLQKIIDDLKGETENRFENRYELRYWGNDRPENPDMVSSDFLKMRAELYWMIQTYLYAEVIDRKTGKIMISYNEEIHNG